MAFGVSKFCLTNALLFLSAFIHANTYDYNWPLSYISYLHTLFVLKFKFYYIKNSSAMFNCHEISFSVLIIFSIIWSHSLVFVMKNQIKMASIKKKRKKTCTVKNFQKKMVWILKKCKKVHSGVDFDNILHVEDI